ncbi:MAG: hypothetical protein K2K75_12680 [Muribaculaceae bacterium]|nr:hypothetical protein [Muribaculaceae bacterium]
MSYSITDLKEKLDPKNIENNEYKKYFDELANMLMNHFVIAKGNDKYEFVEIEFYLFTPEHQDVITYPRKIVESKNPDSGKKEEKLIPMDAGQWFFHQSGVDITFKCDETRFGGILVRGIRKCTADSKTILGPMKCVDELWDNFSAFSPKSKDIPHIEEVVGEYKKNGIKCYKRWIPVKTEDRDKRLSKWIDNLKKYKINVSNQDTTELVFNAQYRYIKDGTDMTKYPAKPKEYNNNIKS